MYNRKHFIENEVKIYTINTEEVEEEAIYQNHYNELSAKRRKKIDQLRFRKDKRLSLCAGILLDRGLMKYGLREKDVEIMTGENGKPYLMNHQEIHFNLSHSENMAMAVFAASPVGCDIEFIEDVNLKLAHRFFAPSEYNFIISQEGEEQKREAFYRLWTLKESFMKATGLGMKLPLKEVCFDLDDEIRISQGVNDNKYWFEEYEFEGYRGAVCCQKEGEA